VSAHFLKEFRFRPSFYYTQLRLYFFEGSRRCGVSAAQAHAHVSGSLAQAYARGTTLFRGLKAALSAENG
jgi:hypothetical protein